MSDFTISSDAISHNGDAIDIQNSSGSLESTMEGFTFSNNIIDSNRGVGFNISNKRLMSDFMISSDAISNREAALTFKISSGTFEGYMESFTVSDNTIESNTGNGFNISNNGLMSDLTIEANIISSNTGIGIQIQIYRALLEATMEGFTVSNDIIEANGSTGLNISNNGLISDFTISSDAISNYGGGIDIEISSGTFEGSMDGFTVSNNIIESNTGNGFNISNNGLMSDFTIEANSISSNTGNGIQIQNFIRHF